MKISKKNYRIPNRKLVDDQIEEILNYFEFDRIHNMMAADGWAWFATGEVPTENELKSEAERLLRDVTEDLSREYYEISTGGLIAKYSLHKDNNGNFFRVDLFWGIDTANDGVSY